MGRIMVTADDAKHAEIKARAKQRGCAIGTLLMEAYDRSATSPETAGNINTETMETRCTALTSDIQRLERDNEALEQEITRLRGELASSPGTSIATSSAAPPPREPKPRAGKCPVCGKSHRLSEPCGK